MNANGSSAVPSGPGPRVKGSTFGLGLGTMFGDAFKTYAANVVPLSLAALATLLTYGVFRYPAQQLDSDGRVFASVGVDLVGLLLAGVVAVPWYHYSLAAFDGKPILIGEPFKNRRLFGYQAVASFWFWAGILLGIRYLFGLPSLLVLLLYCFHGFVIVDGAVRGGMLALGQSVRLSEGRRLGLFAVGGLLLVFNLFGLVGIGLEIPLFARFGVAILGATVTTSVTMLAGAALYRLCQADLPVQKAPQGATNAKMSSRRQKKKKSTRQNTARQRKSSKKLPKRTS